MKKVVKERASLYQSDVLQRCKCFEKYLEKEFKFSQTHRIEIAEKASKIFLAPLEEEITQEELTDDMTLVKITSNDIFISFADDAHKGYDYAYAVLSKKDVIRKGIICKKLADLISWHNYTTYYAFTSHTEALEFALEQLKKLQHD